MAGAYHIKPNSTIRILGPCKVYTERDKKLVGESRTLFGGLQIAFKTEQKTVRVNRRKK